MINREYAPEHEAHEAHEPDANDTKSIPCYWRYGGICIEKELVYGSLYGIKKSRYAISCCPIRRIMYRYIHSYKKVKSGDEGCTIRHFVPSSPRNRRTASYVPNRIAAFGTTRSM